MPFSPLRGAPPGLLLGLVGCFGNPSSGTADAETTSTTSLATGSSTAADPLTSAPGSAGTDVSSSSETGSGSSGSSETGSTSTGGDPSLIFYDDFERPDSLSLANGWLETTPDAWQLLNGSVQFEANAPGFPDAFIVQPSVDLRDAEVSVEFRIASVALDEFPQVHARVDVEATTVTDEARSYGAFVDVLNSELNLLRVVGTEITSFPPTPLATPLVPERLYRISIRTVGDDPVQITGRLERDEAGVWQEDAFVLVVDAARERITDVGAVGVSGNFNIAVLRYDNFSVRDPK